MARYKTLPSRELDSIRGQISVEHLRIEQAQERIARLQKTMKQFERAAKIEKVLRLTNSPNAGEAEAAKAALKKFPASTVRRVRQLLVEEEERRHRTREHEIWWAQYQAKRSAAQ